MHSPIGSAAGKHHTREIPFISQKAIVQNSWSLLDHGLLRKEVIKSAPDQKSFREQAEEFVEQLQQAARPKNALEGLLLDRMASSYLRKVMLLEGEALYREKCRAETLARKKGSPPEEIIRGAGRELANKC
jgi:hypothetical protein